MSKKLYGSDVSPTKHSGTVSRIEYISSHQIYRFTERHSVAYTERVYGRSSKNMDYHLRLSDYQPYKDVPR